MAHILWLCGIRLIVDESTRSRWQDAWGNRHAMRRTAALARGGDAKKIEPVESDLIQALEKTLFSGRKLNVTLLGGAGSA